MKCPNSPMVLRRISQVRDGNRSKLDIFTMAGITCSIALSGVPGMWEGCTQSTWNPRRDPLDPVVQRLREPIQSPGFEARF